MYVLLCVASTLCPLNLFKTSKYVYSPSVRCHYDDDGVSALSQRLTHMNAPILIPRTHIKSVPPIGCLFAKGSDDSLQSAKLDGPYREGSRLQRCIITVASEVPFSAPFRWRKGSSGRAKRLAQGLIEQPIAECYWLDQVSL